MGFALNVKKFLITSLLLSIIIIQGCVHRIDEILITGELKGLPKTNIYVNRFESDSLVFIDSIKTSSKGKFSFNVKSENPVFISIGLQRDQSQIVLLIQPGDEIIINSLNHDLSDYQVFGSYGSALVQNLTLKLRETKHQLDSLKNIFESNLQSIKIDSVKQLVDSLYQIKIKNHKDFAISFIKENLYSPASILALFQSYDTMHPVFDYSNDRKLFKLVDSSLMSVYSSNKMVLNFHEKIQKLDSLIERISKRGNTYKVGEVLPNVGFPLISGENLFYSGIWYRYMLVDFTSLSCELCQKNQMNIKPIYKEFSPRGLVLLQVSLGVNIDSLKVRVVRDSITWYNVGYPDQFRSKLLDTLKVTSIPANYIIDRWGVIKAVNLKGESLRQKLTELMPK